MHAAQALREVHPPPHLPQPRHNPSRPLTTKDMDTPPHHHRNTTTPRHPSPRHFWAMIPHAIFWYPRFVGTGKARATQNHLNCCMRVEDAFFSARLSPRLVCWKRTGRRNFALKNTCNLQCGRRKLKKRAMLFSSKIEQFFIGEPFTVCTSTHAPHSTSLVLVGLQEVHGCRAGGLPHKK